jgi:hypothetical protein
MLLSKILKGEYDKKELVSKLKLSVYITGGLCLFFALFGSAFLNFQGSNDGQMQKEIVGAVIADRKSLLRMDALRSLVFILLSAGVIWAFVTERLKKNLFIGGIGLLVFIDLFTVGKRYLDNGDFISKNEYNKYFESSQVDQLILKETSKDYRVFNLATNTFSDSRTSYFHKSIGGYHAAKLRRYQEIIEHQLTKSDSTKKSPYPFNKSVIDMLNTKYIIVKSGKNEQVVPNTGTLDNAWFVHEVNMVNNADEEMKALDSMDVRDTAIVQKTFEPLIKFQPAPDSGAGCAFGRFPTNIYAQSSGGRILATGLVMAVSARSGRISIVTAVMLSSAFRSSAAAISRSAGDA